jgi:aminopeptidase N
MARSFRSVAITDAHSAKLREVLDGKIAGLTIDVDLRWHLVVALAERGVLSRTDLEAELARDKTKTGEEMFAQAIAALPTREAKDAAWQVIIADETSNAVRVNTVQGFQRPIQRELLAGYVDTYFAA